MLAYSMYCIVVFSLYSFLCIVVFSLSFSYTLHVVFSLLFSPSIDNPCICKMSLDLPASISL